MKRILFAALALILIASLAWGWSAGLMGGGVAATEEVLCSCTGDLLFCWSAESTTVTSGTPAGCSVGDTSATAASAVELSSAYYKTGTYSVHPTSTSDYYEFSVSSEDIVKSDAGRVEVWVYNPAGNATNQCVFVRGDSTNTITLYYINNTARMDYKGNNISQSFNGPSGTITDDGWTYIVYSWSVAAVSGHYMRIGTSSDGSTPTNWTYHDTAITDLVVNPGTVRIGETQGSAYDHYIDDIKIYGAW